MLGGIIMIAVLLMFPAMAVMGCVAVAGLLGTVLTTDAEARFEGTEQLELTR